MKAYRKKQQTIDSPDHLVMDLGDRPLLAIALTIIQPLPTVMPSIGTLALAILFTHVALWHFQREEL